jgi:peptidyl-prolyl cis-trans isomerase A (cyclophilin A)
MSSLRHIEPLESRTLLNATMTSAIGTVTTTENASPTTIDLTQHFDDPMVVGTAVLMKTSQGDIPLTLFDTKTPQTVTNFLNYVDTGEYDNTVIHRAIPTFGIEGGTYLPDQTSIAVGAPVPSEAGISNTVGTIAAALQSGPGTATSGWFINTANNSSFLDNSSDGGPFTVFGTVIYGMSVVNAIADLPKGIVQPVFAPDPTLKDPTGGVLPLQNYGGGAIAPDNYVTIPSVQVVSPLAFTATSDNTAVVVPTISNGVLSLNYQPNQTGVANVTVTATDLGFGTQTPGMHIVSTTFKVALGDVLGSGGAKQIRFTDADGTRTTLSLTGPGNANVQFNGTVTSESLTKAGIRTVTGTGLSIASISLTGTTAASALNVTGAGGNGMVEIGTISAAGDLRAINATRGALSGNLTTAGSVSRITLNSATGATITIGGTGGSVALAISSASGEAIASSEAISSVQSSSWLAASGGSTAQFSAPSIGRITVTRQLNANFATGNLSTVNAGSVTPSTWSLNGTLGTLSAGSITGLNLTAAAIGRINDRGAAAQDVVSSAGNITAISALGMTGTRIDAGNPTLDSNGLPTAFPTSATIRTVTVGRGGFSNSTIGAQSFGNVSLGAVASSNGGTPFGIGAHQIKLLTATVDGKRLTLRNPGSESDVAAALSNAGIAANDLVIRIV